MQKPSVLGTQIEGIFEITPGYVKHPAGHSEYLLRYRTTAGIPFAIGRTANSAVRFWMLADVRFKSAAEAKGFICTHSVPISGAKVKRGTGRNSNLDTIPEFRDRPLYWASVASPGEAQTLASILK